MPQLSTADHCFSPPRVTVPRDYNAAWDLIQRNLQAGRGGKAAFIDDAGSTTYGELAALVNLPVDERPLARLSAQPAK
ncbi:MAG: hypothetical protein IT368_03745 [Candidatus Hydrogenedentes bacterium]|nr:hypothetical protein [Candidatus Hydrogenedentota bacterium]